MSSGPAIILHNSILNSQYTRRFHENHMNFQKKTTFQRIKGCIFNLSFSFDETNKKKGNFVTNLPWYVSKALNSPEIQQQQQQQQKDINLKDQISVLLRSQLKIFIPQEQSCSRKSQYQPEHLDHSSH